LACVTGEASVSPYPSKSTAPPVISANRSATAVGKGAAPEMHAFTDRRSNFATSGDSLIALKKRGTPGTNVGFSLSISSITRWRSRGFGIGTSVPARRIATFITNIPKEWKNGSAPSRHSFASSISQ
jgi:hypothetical protein